MHVERTGAQLLVESLYQAGLTTLFGLPGDTGISFYDALHARRDRMRHVLARDERSAAQMADAYARCTNTVGVVEASSGGGTTYLVGGLGEPYAASVPLLILTSDIHRASRGSGALTEIDQGRLFSAVTRWSATASSAHEIPALISAALAAATTGRPGPASVIIPEDVLDERSTVTIAGAETVLPRERPAADEALVRAAADALQRARRPAIVAGSGLHLSAAWGELEQVAEQAGIPVATTIQGKGSIAETGPWSLGVVGANGARDYANAYLAGADAVLLIGTRANATDTNSYQSPPREGPTVIQIDIDAARAGRNFPGSLPLVGDARTVLRQLVQALSPSDAERRERLRAWVAERRQAWIASATRTAPHATTSELHPADVIQAIQELAGNDVVVVADPGTPTPYVAAYWETAVAARRVLCPRGHGPMGYAIPGAIGAALACPGRTIVGLTTDGSLAMSCGELETACRLALPIIYVQFTNGSFGWIKMLQHLYLDRRYFGVDLGPIDAVAVARGFGLQAARATTLDELRQIFRAYQRTARPGLVDVVVADPTQVVPPVAPWQAALKGQGGRPVY
ncbi:MAG TPA: thiamine pyrophosphate-binding protein [Chloroflexota bacterium]|nr:thiamine pyrophosphate-binding protein [Chloroflexota bacterium]